MGALTITRSLLFFMIVITNIMSKSKTYLLINSKTVFIITLVVILLTILGVYFAGLGSHRTFFENSILSTTILSIAFFSFLAVGLYNGMKLKDNLGSIVDKYKVFDTPNMLNDLPSEGIDIGEGCIGIIVSIALWILIAILISIAVWVFSNVVVVAILAFAGMLYWVFFRALRLVFRNSGKTKGDIFESFKIAAAYTLLYNFWIYGIMILIEYLKR